jgi:colanic acid/amylovoran biosynthesis glycosyltransferase
VTLGNYNWTSGIDYLLTSFTQLKYKQVQFRSKIIGNGELRYAFEFSLMDLNLNDCVELCYDVTPNQLLEIIGEADIIALSGHTEESGKLAIVALLAGRPIVATNTSCVHQSVSHLKNGFIVPVRDVESLTEYIEILLLDPLLRNEMEYESIRLASLKKLSVSDKSHIDDIYNLIFRPTGK